GKVVVGLVPGAAAIVEPETNLKIERLNVEKKGEKVAKREVQLDIDNSKGAAVSFLKELDGVSDFQIRTPQGIAAARGTAWRSSGGGSIQVLNGNVTFNSGTGQSITVPAGFSLGGGDGTVTQLSQAELDALVSAINSTPGFSATFDATTGSFTLGTPLGDFTEILEEVNPEEDPPDPDPNPDNDEDDDENPPQPDPPADNDDDDPYSSPPAI
ncbi:MAG: hypothetical protein AAF558_13460, partial [Verrucomicrobiota bacterium]